MAATGEPTTNKVSMHSEADAKDVMQAMMLIKTSDNFIFDFSKASVSDIDDGYVASVDVPLSPQLKGLFKSLEAFALVGFAEGTPENASRAITVGYQWTFWDNTEGKRATDSGVYQKTYNQIKWGKQ